MCCDNVILFYDVLKCVSHLVKLVCTSQPPSSCLQDSGKIQYAEADWHAYIIYATPMYKCVIINDWQNGDNEWGSTRCKKHGFKKFKRQTDWKTNQNPVDEFLLNKEALAPHLLASSLVRPAMQYYITEATKGDPLGEKGSRHMMIQVNNGYIKFPLRNFTSVQIEIDELLWSISQYLRVFRCRGRLRLTSSFQGGGGDSHTDMRRQKRSDRQDEWCDANTGASRTNLSQPYICQWWKWPCAPLKTMNEWVKKTDVIKEEDWLSLY